MNHPIFVVGDFVTSSKVLDSIVPDDLYFVYAGSTTPDAVGIDFDYYFRVKYEAFTGYYRNDDRVSFRLIDKSNVPKHIVDKYNAWKMTTVLDK